MGDSMESIAGHHHQQVSATRSSNSALCPAYSKRAAFASRTSSHSSILSSSASQPTLLLNEALAEHFTSRSSTPSSHINTESGESVSVANAWVPKQQGNFHVLQHLYKHASTYGLDVASLNNNNNCSEKNMENEMSQQGDNNGGLHQSAAFLSWRKLHLSKAKLKAASNTSALLAGFAMVAVVEIQLNKGQIGELPDPLLILFAVCTTLLVAVHMLALLISTCILPNMEAISNLHSLSLVNESPHEKMHLYIELAWGCSTVLGILLFMIEVTILCWIQFYNVLKSAAYVATAILVPFVILFVWFAFIFYRKLVAHTYEVRKSGIQELEMLKHGLEMGDVELSGHRKLRTDSLEHVV